MHRSFLFFTQGHFMMHSPSHVVGLTGCLYDVQHSPLGLPMSNLRCLGMVGTGSSDHIVHPDGVQLFRKEGLQAMP